MHFVHFLHKIFAMILELTAGDLKRLGFNTDEIKNLLNRKQNYDLQNNSGDFYFDYKQNKIYTDIDKKRYFLQTGHHKMFPFNYPDLIPEYFELNLKEYLDEHQTILGSLFNIKEQTKEFIFQQIAETKEFINYDQNYIDKHHNYTFKHKLKSIIVYKGYLFYLENKTKIVTQELSKNEVKKPRQIETDKPDEVKKIIYLIRIILIL